MKVVKISFFLVRKKSPPSIFVWVSRCFVFKTQVFSEDCHRFSHLVFGSGPKEVSPIFGPQEVLQTLPAELVAEVAGFFLGSPMVVSGEG